MGISPAPQVEDIKPYPKPVLKTEAAATGNSVEIKVRDLEAYLADATTKGLSAGVTSAIKKDLAAAKAELAKTTKGSTPKGIL